MSYNQEAFPRYINTAGKITVFAALAGVAVFFFALIFDFSAQEITKATAQNATTSLTVLNTPPSFTIEAYEVVGSSSTDPTNSGDTITWGAVANDSNGAPYFLLVCATSATPTAQAAANVSSLGTAPPYCAASTTLQWAVSTATLSDTLATAATTTAEGSLFAEENEWWAWVCDDDPFNPRCNDVPTQGLYSTSSSPFNVNSRPVLTDFYNDGPVDPGELLTFSSTSSDPDSVGGDDELTLVVCVSNSNYSTSTDSCTDQLATTTVAGTDNVTATRTIEAIRQDDTYTAFGYLVDEHGHESLGIPLQANYDVNNVAPTVAGGTISLNGGGNFILTQGGAETTGFTLDFTVADANSCENVFAGDEITDYQVSIYRGTTSDPTTICDGSGEYDPNDCYPSQVATSTWNLDCTASSTSCTGSSDDTVVYNCTFPLWFVADPTDDAAPNIPAAFAQDSWFAAVAGIDDDFATGTLATTSSPVELDSFAFLALDSLSDQIPYGALEPGDDSGTLNASTTVQNLGNTGIDNQVRGSSMCGTYSLSTPCPVSGTSTIPENEQQYSSTSVAYNSPAAIALSSTTYGSVEIDVPQTIATNTTLAATGTTFWGIAVPGSITLAGTYEGLNEFLVQVAEAIDW